MAIKHQIRIHNEREHAAITMHHSEVGARLSPPAAYVPAAQRGLFTSWNLGWGEELGIASCYQGG